MLYELKNLAKTYGEGGAKVVALSDINLTIPDKKIVVVLGASGSGKSTLLNLLGCMDSPTSGSVFFRGEEISEFDRKQKTEFRKQRIGFVFQNYNLLPDLTALENVEFSTELSGVDKEAAKEAMALVGLSDRLHHFPKQLSGGEQQRVSIARAIAKRPAVLLCDEPTGALDLKTGIKVLEVLVEIHRENGTSIVLITHNNAIANIADTVITMGSGEVMRVENRVPLGVAEVAW